MFPRTEVATSSYPAYALARQSAGVIRYFQFLLKTSIYVHQKLRSNISNNSIEYLFDIEEIHLKRAKI